MGYKPEEQGIYKVKLDNRWREIVVEEVGDQLYAKDIGILIRECNFDQYEWKKHNLCD
jgi:hypothetical protein